LSDPLFHPRQKVGDYLIEKEIGKGGMSELFLAKDRALKRTVVIKVISPVFSRRDDFKKRFMSEAKIQANLDNLHIVQIFRIFEYQHNLCLVMQHIRGTDLAEVVKKAKSMKEIQGKKGALYPERAIHIFLQVLEGIGFVHKYGIMHGDIKPPNILLDQQGMVKVSDFGLSSLSPNSENRKEEMLLGGTPSYMSPEQILNEKVDFRSDIYSLGVTFFYMLTGQSHSGDKKNLTELLEFHIEGSLDEPKIILDEFFDIRLRIKESILKALENEPNNRHQSCLEFSLAIKTDEPYEMYSELLRVSVLTKTDITLAERVYLDEIAGKKGLGVKEAEALEINIRLEMGLSPLDFTREYEKAFIDLLIKGRENEAQYRDELETTYAKKGRISQTQARLIRKKVKADLG
jgi:serine/threonine-protein kinase